MARSNVDMLIQARDQASPALAKVDKQLAGLEMSAAGLMTMLGGGYALARVADFTWEMGKLGAESLDTGASFEAMMRSVGQSTDILDRMREAAGGTVSDLKLMQGVNSALANTTGQLSVAMADAQDKLLLAARAAHKLNPALGSVEYLYRSLNIGVKRNQKLLIDNALITFNAAEQQKKLATSLGKSVKELTNEEQALATLAGTLEGADRLIAQLDGDVSSAGDAFTRLETAIGNVKTELAELVAVPTAQLAQGLADMVRNLGLMVKGEGELKRAYDDLAAAEYKVERAQRKLTEAIDLGWNWLIKSRQATVKAAKADLEVAKAALKAAGAVSDMADEVERLGYSTAYWVTAAPRVVDAIDEIAEAMGGKPWAGIIEGAADIGPGTAYEFFRNMRLGDIAEEEGKAAGARLAEALASASGEQRGMLEGIMQPTQAFDATGKLDAIGQHVDTWDEAARRMADVANRGAESPWAKMLDIPEDVLAAGGDKLKGYAANYVRDFYLGLHTADIDKEAVKSLYKKMLLGKQEREAMLAQLQKELGGVDMALLRKAAGVQDPAAAMIADFGKTVGESESEIGGIAESFASIFVENVLESDAIEGFVNGLWARMLNLISDWGDEE